MDTLAELPLRLLPGDRGDASGELVEVFDAEPVIDGGVDRLGDPGVGGEVHLELADARSLLFDELLLRQAVAAEARDLLERRGERRIPVPRLDRQADHEGPRQVR